MSSKGSSRGNQAPFTLLEEGKPRWRSFGAGFVFEILILMCALWIPALFPQQMETAKQYIVSEITAPTIEAWKPQPKIVPHRRAARRPEVRKAIADPPKPKLIEPVFERPLVARRERKKSAVAPEIRERTKAVPEFSLANSALPELKKPRAPIQTGGFGDPDSLPNARKVTHAVNMAQAGAFDRPAGPGQGNGKGGAKGVVARTGFGNDTAVAARRQNSGRVQEGSFGSEQLAAGPHVQKTSARTPVTEPVVILYKPTPQYTAEAKQQRIQGDVLVQVVFKKSGQVQVVRVVRGLGHGLDASAEAAARKIRFKPAEENGRAVDFPATVRIQFELAY